MKYNFFKFVLFFLSFQIVSVTFEIQNNESKSSAEKKERWIFIGNPGVGKSTIINSLLGHQLAPAGTSVGVGLTKRYQEYVHGNIIYIDTPGLNDIENRKSAAKEIEEALKKDGQYKIFFVFTVQGARVNQQDIFTMETIFDALNMPDLQFNVLLNRINQQEEKFLNEIGEYINSGKYKTNKIEYIALSIPILTLESSLIEFSESNLLFFHQSSLSMMKQSDTIEHINGKEFSEVMNDMEEKTIENKKIIQKTLKKHEELLFLETPKSICELINLSSDEGWCSLM